MTETAQEFDEIKSVIREVESIIPGIILPKKHFSWSQFDLWKRNKNMYRNMYFANGKKMDTKYLAYGKSIADAIENGSYKDMLPDLHVYEEVEYRIFLRYRGIPLLAYLDSYSPTLHVFDEYKTGKNPWNNAKVQKHEQLLFYATLLEIESGEMPWYCDLHWLETAEKSEEDGFWQNADRKIAITGQIKTFRREFDKREIERMKAEIVKVAQEISEDYKKFILEI